MFVCTDLLNFGISLLHCLFTCSLPILLQQSELFANTLLPPFFNLILYCFVNMVYYSKCSWPPFSRHGKTSQASVLLKVCSDKSIVMAISLKVVSDKCHFLSHQQAVYLLPLSTAHKEGCSAVPLLFSPLPLLPSPYSLPLIPLLLFPSPSPPLIPLLLFPSPYSPPLIPLLLFPSPSPPP